MSWVWVWGHHDGWWRWEKVETSKNTVIAPPEGNGTPTEKRVAVYQSPGGGSLEILPVGTTTENFTFPTSPPRVGIKLPPALTETYGIRPTDFRRAYRQLESVGFTLKELWVTEDTRDFPWVSWPQMVEAVGSTLADLRESDGRPLNLRCSPHGGQVGVILGVWDGSFWKVSRQQATAVVKKELSSPSREVLFCLQNALLTDPTSQKALAALASMLGNNPRVRVLCGDETLADLVEERNLTAVRDRRRWPVDVDDNWVFCGDRERNENLASYCQVVGPGGDIHLHDLLWQQVCFHVDGIRK